MEVKDLFSGFSVKSLDDTQAFYSDTLGLKVTRDDMGLQIALPQGGAVFIYEKPGHIPAVFTIFNVVVASIDTAIKELEGKGVTFLRYDTLPASQDELGVLRGKAAGMGPDIAWFKDPSGNVLGLLEAPNN